MIVTHFPCQAGHPYHISHKSTKYFKELTSTVRISLIRHAYSDGPEQLSCTLCQLLGDQSMLIRCKPLVMSRSHR